MIHHLTLENILKTLGPEARLVSGPSSLIVEKLVSEKFISKKISQTHRKNLLAVISNSLSLESLDLENFSAFVGEAKVCQSIQEMNILPQQVALISSAHPSRFSLYLLCDLFHNLFQKKTQEGVHPTAVVHDTARIGKGCFIGPYCFVGAETTIFDNCYLSSHVSLENNVQIGSGTKIHPFTFVAHSTQIGSQCNIHSHSSIGLDGFGYVQDKKNGGIKNIPHLGRVIIGDRVTLHSHANIHRGTLDDTIIENDNKMDSFSHIAHNSHLGPMNAMADRASLAGSSFVEGECFIGGAVTISPKVKVGKGCTVSSGSHIRQNCKPHTKYFSNPLNFSNCLEREDYIKAHRAFKKLIASK